MNEITIEADYIGKVLSVNHYKAFFRKKPEVKAWMDEIGWLLKGQGIDGWQTPLTVTCDGRFRDRRSRPDLANLSKVTLDAIQEGTGVNDREMRWRDGLVSYGEPPVLWITITEAH